MNAAFSRSSIRTRSKGSGAPVMRLPSGVIQSTRYGSSRATAIHWSGKSAAASPVDNGFIVTMTDVGRSAGPWTRIVVGRALRLVIVSTFPVCRATRTSSPESDRGIADEPAPIGRVAMMCPWKSAPVGLPLFTSAGASAPILATIDAP